ncbi:MAG TPA: hypothetical protein VGG74_02425, partial [Kofleriaceae bacterium]|jgi:hypothetical protein
MRLHLCGLLLVGLTAPAFAQPNDPSVVTADRDRVELARQNVDLASKLVDIDAQRVDADKIKWDRAVAKDHPDAAGRYAVAHSDALQEQWRGQEALRTARAYLAQSSDKLHADERDQQAMRDQRARDARRGM